ncbi:RNA exonuclease 1 homolog [Branchiostoma floridae]|uniref:RNA exonuclease 1 homolog n=1 Tax=Branchiostoma floridae TaxID=7739 RepID=A0A9J7NDI0_BRAFL|nr:RNA exonuclease 1 homolog [Branchiostoma floridae]
MFTSSGFFKTSPCPFLAEGVCDRSHCHFKHERPTQTESASSQSGSDVSQEDSPGHASTVLRIDIVKDAVVKVRNAMEKEQRDLGHHHGNYMPYDPSASEVPAPAVHTKLPSTMPGIAGTLEYRPTPIAELKKRQAAGADVIGQEHDEYDPTRPSTDIGGSLGYRPTPITELDVQDPPVNKYSEAFKYQGTDMEYDPIMNYCAIPKQQKRKLADISEQGCEAVGSAQPVSKQRKLGRDRRVVDTTQDSLELTEGTRADNVSNNKEIEPRISQSDMSQDSSNNERTLRVSESDMASDTGLGISVKGNRTKSKSSVKKTGKLSSDVSSAPGRDDIKRRKTSKHPKDAHICKDESDEKAAKHGDVSLVKSKVRTKEKDVKSKVDGKKKNSTSKNPTKEVNTTHKESQQQSKVKRLTTENRSASKTKSSSTLKSTDKNFSKTSRCEKVFDEENSSNYLPRGTEGDDSTVDSVSEDCSSNDVSDWKKKRRLKRVRHEETRHQAPEDEVYVSSTSDECNTEYGSLMEDDRKGIEHIKHSVSLMKSGTSKISESYHPKLAEKMDNRIKIKKQTLNPSDSEEYLSKLKSTKLKQNTRSELPEGKASKSHKQCGTDSKCIKASSEGFKSSHEHGKGKEGNFKVKSKSTSSCSSNSVSKKGANNDKHGKIMAHKSSRSQKKLIPDSDSDTVAREKVRQSKSAGKKVKSSGDKDKTSKTPGIKVSHADLFGEESEDDTSMATGDGTSQDASSDDPTSGPDLDPEVLRRLEEEEFEDSEDPYEECLRIFQETHGKMADNKMGSQDAPQCEEEDQAQFTSLPGQAGKKRTAHLASFDTSHMKRVTPKRPRPTASQQIHNRYKQLQEMAAAAPPADPEPTSRQSGSLLSSAAQKKRLAHRPKIPPPTGKYSLSNRGTATSQNSPHKSTPPPAATLARTAPKGGRRVAHTPAPTTLKRPTVPAEFGSKIPTSTRQLYLNKIVDECLLICQSEQAAYDRALKEEKDCYDRCTARQGYLTATVSTIRRLRSEHGLTTTPSKAVSSSQQRPKMSHAAVLGGSKAAHTSFSIHRHPSQSTGNSLQGAEVYRHLLQYVLTEEQMKENGFPRPSMDKPGSALLFKEQTKKFSDPTMKSCARCGKQFTVLNNNRYLKRDECVYHHGKLWKRRVAGGFESRYTCCQGDAQADGCCTGELHVWDSRKEDLDGYVTTLQKSPTEDPGVFALDCEMCYTYGGMELTRVSVVNWSNKLVYETLVKPENKVIDYNTRFSPIKEEDMDGIETSIRDVQAVLLSMFSADTILLGHSLESDLLSLKIIHSKVVDTSVVFPHKMGPPFKRALRTLMNEFLQKIIQNDVGGHDSKEDAVACVDLMKWRIKEDIRSSKL